MAEFSCPHWHDGQSCTPYFSISLWWRAPAAIFGTLIGLAAPGVSVVNAIRATPPDAALSTAVVVWGGCLILAGGLGIIVALHHEKDIWGCLLASIGTPTCLLALAALPQLAR
jgi:formate-dependent nitrite reductase membrane component NrfD